MASGHVRSAGPSRVRAVSKTGFARAKRAAFLDHLAATCSVAAASRAVKVSPQAAYALRRRDPLFAVQWSAALDSAYERLEAALLARALGTEDEEDHARSGVAMSGGSPGTAKAFDPDLALKLLGRRVPGRDRASRPRPASASGADAQVTVDQVETSLMTKLDAIEKRLGISG